MKVQITVLKKHFFQELADEYLHNSDSVQSCPILDEGMKFIYEGGANMPNGFCPWAWIDIYKTVSAISFGATFSSWYNKKNMSIECCTDGVRPVIFKIEGLPD